MITDRLLALHRSLEDDDAPPRPRVRAVAGVVAAAGLAGPWLAGVRGPRVFVWMVLLLFPLAAFSAWGGAMREGKKTLARARAGGLLAAAGAAGAYLALAG